MGGFQLVPEARALCHPSRRLYEPGVTGSSAAPGTKMVRFKNRYFLCEIVSEDPCCLQLIEERTVHNTVKNAVARIHGDFGLACCSIAFAVKYLNAYTGVVLLCCRKDFYRLLGSSLPFITHLENKNQHYPCSFNTLHVGATIRTCQRFLIQYNRDQLLLLLRNCSSEADRQAILKSVQSCTLAGGQPFQNEEEDSDVSTEMA
ncbi:ribonuclease P/MRP protein subunit POP5 [Rhineura floridana]|uniref:ribonuclease P/MRP protein subunit POP5 n=1 Tax=Rhineura floridana TaxID=261503 RepID=UPI002AC821D0|nr:ribonuclease P/MRP protein subunit POP5 [Rhineura floridana]